MRLACILSTCLLLGCSTYIPVEEYDVSSFKLVLGSKEYVDDMWDAVGGKKKLWGVDGFIHYPERTIYVKYNGEDYKGRRTPDFNALGHEVWHLQELGHRWHK